MCMGHKNAKWRKRYITCFKIVYYCDWVFWICMNSYINNDIGTIYLTTAFLRTIYFRSLSVKKIDRWKLNNPTIYNDLTTSECLNFWSMVWYFNKSVGIPNNTVCAKLLTNWLCTHMNQDLYKRFLKHFLPVNYFFI